ncbi:universal stress protein [Blastococcus tunisiensis]|uniref:Nucleotide-binding universal stress protein, UspA family n=1 Tax=Blastococcus tunisiensis TaxID=1798228 RepID=A0A1I2DZU9_9ACTN|nr:universal stress protein [Blastococcus sp. DSM 46838]SFE85946.1 Nucleotide-binding universal stress protein, UspA family [Blastococcus sp. DSM 46838]
MHEEFPSGRTAEDRRLADGGGRHVVVGVDGSPGSREALAYGLTAAARRGVDVEVVATYPLPLPWAGGTPAVVPDPAALRQGLEAAVREIVADVQRGPSGVPAADGGAPRILVSVSEGPAAPVLVERSRHADLLVVGSRGRGAVRSAVLGSVALQCVAGAACPVLVVPSPAAERPAGPPLVVVGIDGSAHARAALRVAITEARRLGAAVEAVAAYDPGGRWTELDESVAPSFEGIRADVEHGAAAMVDEALADDRAAGGGSAPDVRVAVVEGIPAEVLVSWSHGAELLVVGSRGRGGIRGLLLGSVALRCLVSSACPVLVVPPGADRPAEAPGHVRPAVAAS